MAKALFTYQQYTAVMMTVTALENNITKRGIILDAGQGDIKRKKRLQKIARKIYDESIKTPLIGPKELREYYQSASEFFDHIYTSSYNKDVIGGQSRHDFLASLMGAGTHRFYTWLEACFRHDVEPYLIYIASLNDFGKTYREVTENLGTFDLHIQTECQTKYPEEVISGLAESNKIMIGVDDTLDKINFSLMPFLIREEKVMEDFLRKEGTRGVYFNEIREFSRKYGERLVRMIPPFVSFPAVMKLDERYMEMFHSFFKGKTRKVIVKGNYSVASGKGSHPYLILDVNHPNAVHNWFISILKYQTVYCEGLKKQKSAIMIQCMVGEHDTHHPFNNEFHEHLKLSAHKHNVVGDCVWDLGIKYVNMLRKEAWHSHEGTDMGIIEASRTCTADATHKKTDLEIAGEFLNLVSPMGCHALDLVFGRLEGEAEHNIYLLEANPSMVRGDFNGTNHYTGGDTVNSYVVWALDHFNGNRQAAGKYTRQLFQQLDADAKKEFVHSLHAFWLLVQQLLEKYIFFCGHDETKIIPIWRTWLQQSKK